MDWSVAKIGATNQGAAHAIGLSTPPIGCVLYMPGLPGGSNKIYDRSPYGHIGTIVGAVWKRLPSGLWYLDFDGVDDYVTITHSTSLDMEGTAFALGAWVKLVNVTSGGVIFSKTGGTGNPGNYEFRVVNDDIELNFYNAAERNLLVADIMTTDWTLLYMTWDKTYLRGYQNGALVGTSVDYSATPPLKNTDDLKIGERYSILDYLGSQVLHRIHNVCPTATQIQNIYNQEKHLFGVW